MRLREWRTRHGLTQAQAAERLGVVRSVLSTYETGYMWPSLEVQARIYERSGREVTGQDWVEHWLERAKPSGDAASVAT